MHAQFLSFIKNLLDSAYQYSNVSFSPINFHDLKLHTTTYYDKKKNHTTCIVNFSFMLACTCRKWWVLNLFFTQTICLYFNQSTFVSGKLQQMQFRNYLPNYFIILKFCRAQAFLWQAKSCYLVITSCN